MNHTDIKVLLNHDFIGKNVTVKAWVKFFRNSSFLIVNDGSCIQNLQAVLDIEKFPESSTKNIHTGCSVELFGLIQKSLGKGQDIELIVDKLVVLGEANPDEYPLQAKKHSLEFLREIAHLRPRTTTFGAIFRIRHAMTFAVHQFFNQQGFFNIHTPIITATDAEGAGEMFRVTTLPAKNPPLNADGEVDFKQDFFGKEANLTVTGQLNGELAAMGLGKIYTFGPTFRAENSNTTRHLAEFWMIEPEMAFYDIVDNQNLAEAFLKYLFQYALDNCYDDLLFLEQRLLEEEKSKPQDQKSEMKLTDKLRFVIENNFERITYTEAFEILKNSTPNKKKKFNYLVEEWGMDLQSEHERFLVEKHFKKPVIVTNYPAHIKAFYMKQNDDGKTVAAMDVLFPGIGEIVGGSQREERLDVLRKKCADFNIPEEELWWYMDTRKFGSVPHAGFGLGFERMVMFVTGMTNIRDVIPFPRTPQNAEF